MINIDRLLLERFGYSSFRPGQREVIEQLLSGRDAVAIFPTGMGKSLCYQLPAYAMGGTVVIISPLVALMEDQVANLRNHKEKRAAALNSFLSRREKEYVLSSLHQYKFIFLSPEMLLRKEVLALIRNLSIAFYVVDEAHCISEWGFDFRPDYLRLKQALQQLPEAPVLALTATADDKTVRDIEEYLQLTDAYIERQPIDRPFISYSVVQLANEAEKTEWLIDRLASTAGPGIIYVASRKRADELAFLLQQQNIRCASYHGGKEQEERAIIQEQFIQNELQWICATNAFGMGIHKDNIRQVIHEHLPAAPSAYIQEVGRAGRDGKPAAATLLYCEQDIRKLKFIVYEDLPDEQQIRYYHSLAESDASMAAERAGLSEVAARLLDYYFERFNEQQVIEQIENIRQIKDRQITEMNRYAASGGCLREQLLSYFGERPEPQDNCCSNCGLAHQPWLEKTAAAEQKTTVRWQERLQHLLG